jgi:hypothetical protein
MILGIHAPQIGAKFPSFANALHRAVINKYSPTLNTAIIMATITPHQSFPVLTKVRQ